MRRLGVGRDVPGNCLGLCFAACLLFSSYPLLSLRGSQLSSPFQMRRFSHTSCWPELSCCLAKGLLAVLPPGSTCRCIAYNTSSSAVILLLHVFVRFNLGYWGLDYPPLTAYVSWACGMISTLVEPASMVLGLSRGYETGTHKVRKNNTRRRRVRFSTRVACVPLRRSICSQYIIDGLCRAPVQKENSFNRDRTCS